MKRKVLVVVSIVAALLAVVILFLTGRGDADVETSFSVYSDGEVVRIFDGDDVEITLNVGAKKISEQEDPVFGILKDFPRVEVKVYCIQGMQVLVVHGCTLREVIAEGQAIILLEDCKLVKGKEPYEIITRRDSARVFLNRNMHTKAAMRTEVGYALNTFP